MGQDSTHYLKLLVHLSNSDSLNLHFKYKNYWALTMGMMSKFLSEMKAIVNVVAHVMFYGSGLNIHNSLVGIYNAFRDESSHFECEPACQLVQ